MSKIFIFSMLITAFIGMLVVQPDSSALDDAAYLQCEGGTVARGDSEDSVRAKCGNPQKVTQEDVDSPVVWFYNFGPTEFVYYITFTNGVVERIEMGGYGD
jgi:hypothetical protein